MAGIKEYSLTAASNTAINSISIAEGCAPSGINDAIRQEMADTRGFYECGGWIDLGLTHTYSSSTAVTIASNVTASYVAGRRIKAVGSGTGTIYGVIASSSYSAPNTTVNFTWDSGSLTNETLTVYVGWVLPTGYPINSTAIKGSAAGNMVNTGASTSGHIPKYTDTSGTALADGYGVDTDTTLAANSDSNVATQKATKAYADLKAALASVNAFTKAQRGTPVVLTDGATVAVDASLGNNFEVKLGGNRTLGVPTNIAAGQSGSFQVYQDSTGSRTLAYSWCYGFAGGTAPTLTTTALGRDKLSYDVVRGQSATVIITIATPGVVTYTGHGLQTGDWVQITTSGALPTGLTASTTYWVVYVDANSFSLATTKANAAAGTKIATSGSQSGTHTLTCTNIDIAAAKDFR